MARPPGKPGSGGTSPYLRLMTVPTVVRWSAAELQGVTSHGEATQQAPVRAEPHPTCATAPHPQFSCCTRLYPRTAHFVSLRCQSQRTWRERRGKTQLNLPYDVNPRIIRRRRPQRDGAQLLTDEKREKAFLRGSQRLS